ncbi:ferredoxin [Dactylosporangium sp. CA-233914]|uniref:ferredoxin n=1 Tax=Dactylosporangium sp. CA-233914 TaxID=3239934 RepID=UPI003D8F517D
MKVRADTSVCVASGMCVLNVPDVFDQREEDGLVELLDEQPPQERHEAVRMAVLGCPSGALSVEE